MPRRFFDCVHYYFLSSKHVWVQAAGALILFWMIGNVFFVFLLSRGLLPPAGESIATLFLLPLFLIIFLPAIVITSIISIQMSHPYIAFFGIYIPGILFCFYVLKKLIAFSKSPEGEAVSKIVFSENPSERPFDPGLFILKNLLLFFRQNKKRKKPRLKSGSQE